jgi:hypothetical protein
VGRGGGALGAGAARACHPVKGNAEDYEAELVRRLGNFFSDQAQGYDIPPAVLYRLEGFIEAGITAGFSQPQEIQDRLIAAADKHQGKEVAEFYRQDFRLVLHSRLPTAPVYPSTKSK